MKLAFFFSFLLATTMASHLSLRILPEDPNLFPSDACEEEDPSLLGEHSDRRLSEYDTLDCRKFCYNVARGWCL